MNSAGVDLNQLRALDALLSTRSVTAAARRLGITQAAASNALRRLRAQFGDDLLVRAGQRMTLTPRARALTDPSAEVMRAVEAVLAPESRFAPSTLHATFTVATSDHVELVLLPRVEQLLDQEAPGVDLHVRPFQAEFADDLRQGKVELAIAPLHERSPDLVVEPLFQDPFVWVMRADHPACSARRSAKAFASLRHLLVSPRGTSGGPVDRALGRLGLGRRVARTMPSFGAALLLLRRSDLVAALPRRLVEEVGKELGLTWCALPFSVPPVRIFAISHRRTNGDARHGYLRDTVRRAASALR